MAQADFGFVGLGVMGHMLGLNMERHKHRVAGYDLDPGKVATFNTHEPGINLFGYADLPAFIAALEQPRLIMMMVPAGRPVDSVIQSLKPLLSPGDLLIDGGNSHFLDTERRQKELENSGIRFMGAGVSGGEMGALWGPSLMPGGERAAWELIRPYFEAIAAKVGGEACVAYIGPRGAGHFVKAVHNGIEYGLMQLIAEAYDVLHRGLKVDNDQLHEIFSRWNKGELESYLIEITANIFNRVDPETGTALVDLIVDEAEQKGTGKWTSQAAMDLGVSVPTINASVDARLLSALKEERLTASHLLNGPQPKIDRDSKQVIARLEEALYAAWICTFAQGFALMQSASVEYKYDLELSEIARIWRGGCIIRASLLNDIRQAYAQNPKLSNLMMHPGFAPLLNERQKVLREVVMLAAQSGIPAPGFSTALAYYDAFRTARLPANLTQAQRDYFGAHTYRRLDREGIFHTEWADEQAPPIS